MNNVLIKQPRTLFVICLLCVFARSGFQTLAAESPCNEPATSISGSLIIHGGGKLSGEVLDAFIKLAGGEKAKIVVIPTASDSAEKIDPAKELEPFQKRGAASVVLLHTRSREEADKPEFSEPLKMATGVWFGGGSQTNLENIYVGTLVEKELHELLKRDGVIGGTSAGAAAMSRVMIRKGDTKAEVGCGFGFLTGVVIDQHFLARHRAERLKAMLADHPGLAGLGIDEGTALLCHDRQIGVFGESTVTLCYSASANRPARAETLKDGQLLDLVAISRAAIARAQPPFPPATHSAPEVPGKGTLVIDGGGLPPEAIARFIKAAGGNDALIAVIPTAMAENPPEVPFEAKLLSKAGATNLSIVHAHDRSKANDPKLLEVLKTCKGIWFCGGRQWRLVDAYLDTSAEKLMHELLERGGAIGGSSAGATIQGSYLVRGNPLGNREMMAEGYERGFGFLDGVAIDQHFTQRNRFADMSELKKSFPQLIGLGIDEHAALVVTGHEMEVIGTANVAVYDIETPPHPPSVEKEFQLLKPGEFYDLKTRQRVQKN